MHLDVLKSAVTAVDSMMEPGCRVWASYRLLIWPYTDVEIQICVSQIYYLESSSRIMKGQENSSTVEWEKWEVVVIAILSFLCTTDR